MEMIKGIIDITGSSNHVNIGSDFDGCTTPKDIVDIASMQNFFIELRERFDLSETDVDKIRAGNVQRVINACWK